MTTTRVERHPWTPDSDDGHADLASHDTWIDGVPYATLERLRHEEPVSWVDEEEGSGFWAVTRYSDVIDANHRWDDLTSFRGIRLEEMDAEETEARRTMMELDPPDHTRLRRLVNRGFTRRTVESYEEPIRELTGGILDDALALGEFDFVAEVARVLPMRMLGRLLGVPDEHAERRRAFCRQIGKIHRDKLPRDILRPFVGKEMNALDDHVVGEDKVAEHRGVVGQPARGGIGRDGAQAGDEIGFAQRIPSSVRPELVEGPLFLRLVSEKGRSFDMLRTNGSMEASVGGTHILADRIEQPVREPSLARIEKRLCDIDIFADHRADRHIAARHQLIGTRAQNRLHRAVEPLHRPAAREPRNDRYVDLFDARERAFHDVIEKCGVGLGIFLVLDHPADAMLMEFVDQLGHGCALHLMLIERLDGGETGGGAGLGTFVHDSFLS